MSCNLLIWPFGPLKTAYRKHLRVADQRCDSTPIGKVGFLSCYSKARRDALNIHNIKAGFKGTGIWPVSRRKALSNPQINSTLTMAPETAQGEPKTPQKRKVCDEYTFETPKKGSDVMILLRSLSSADRMGDNRLMVSISRSIAKRIDTQIFRISLQEEEIRQKDHQIKALRPTKRKKVTTDGNTLFASLADAQTTKQLLDMQIQQDMAQQARST